jgi:hypothetical protein
VFVLDESVNAILEAKQHNSTSNRIFNQRMLHPLEERHFIYFQWQPGIHFAFEKAESADIKAWKDVSCVRDEGITFA